MRYLKTYNEAMQFSKDVKDLVKSYTDKILYCVTYLSDVYTVTCEEHRYEKGAWDITVKLTFDSNFNLDELKDCLERSVDKLKSELNCDILNYELYHKNDLCSRKKELNDIIRSISRNAESSSTSMDLDIIIK